MTLNTQQNPDEIFDILGAIEVPKEDKIIHNKSTSLLDSEDILSNPIEINEEISQKNQPTQEFFQEDILQETNISSKDTKSPTKSGRLFSAGIFGLKYAVTSVFIFSMLLLTTNYSAYLNIAKSYIYQDEIAQESKSLLNSMNAAEIKKEEIEVEEKVVVRTKQERIDSLMEQERKVAIKEDAFSMKTLVASLNKEDVDLGIHIVPYENRIIIPKIGKNIPLIDIKEKTVEGKAQLDNIFMKELEEGIVRYPGSARPGEKGNSFIFGHSSNFPWIAGEYNDVFSRLGQVEKGDTVFSYYGQKKYKYKIIEKKVITPNDVSILKRNKNKSELTLMTCWPIGTTLNRLILIGELIEE